MKIIKIMIIILVILLIGMIIISFIDIDTNNNSINTNNISLPIINNIKDIKLTSENYDKLSKEFADKYKDKDELYYYTYSTLYYIFKDGLVDNTKQYINIYNKTINELIDEGKNLMKENNMTVEKYKKQLNN